MPLWNRIWYQITSYIDTSKLKGSASTVKFHRQTNKIGFK